MCDSPVKASEVVKACIIRYRSTLEWVIDLLEKCENTSYVAADVESVRRCFCGTVFAEAFRHRVLVRRCRRRETAKATRWRPGDKQRLPDTI